MLLETCPSQQAMVNLDKGQLRELSQQERQRADQAEQKLLQIEQARIESEQARLELEQTCRELEHQLQPTTLVEYLDGCHKYLFSNISIQANKSLTYKGSITRPGGKRCPSRLVPWNGFLEKQTELLGEIHSTFSQDTRHFDSLHALRTQGRHVSNMKVSNERNLEVLQHWTIEMPVESIMKQLQQDDKIREELQLCGRIEFDYQPNVLSDMGNQICVYKMGRSSDSSSSRELAFIFEYKVPHKLTLQHLRVALRDMDMLKEVVNRSTKPTADEPDALFEYHADRLVAAAISHTFHCMIEGRIEYSYLTTGEGIVFLKIDWADTSILYYHLAVPEQEVRTHTETAVHCTAVSQVLAFTLLAV